MHRLSWMVLSALIAPSVALAAQQQAGDSNGLFCIGEPDAHADEFGLAREGYAAFPTRFAHPVVYEVGKSKTSDWPFIHPAPRDTWAGSRAHTFTIAFEAAKREQQALYLILGIADAHHSERSKVTVTINGAALPTQIAPRGPMRLADAPMARGRPDAMVFAIPGGRVRAGRNTISIRLDAESWIIYDYVALRRHAQPLRIQPRPEPDLLRGAAALVDEIVFAVRKPGRDTHWYANFSYYADDECRVTYEDGGRLCRLNTRTGKLTVLLDDPRGGVRDPQVHYDGNKILFAYRKGGSTHYHLYEIGIDGTGLRQLTSGDYDDVEPTYLPDGTIAFVSTRCKRWVNCWLTQVASIHRCDADGGDIHAISSNNEHDNTPWMLPDGRLLYQRWEYVDRSQVHYHHLWAMNPDGTGQMVFYGNMHPGTVMIDAKPLPDSRRVLAIFSPGHGRREHDGAVVILNPELGPDARSAVRKVHPGQSFRDPFPVSSDLFLVARGSELLLMSERGQTQSIFRLSEQERDAGLRCHEPRALRARVREPVIPSKSDRSKATGSLVLADVYRGRNMAGVRRGEIKKLLVIESLPKPINFTGGMEPLTYGGSFTLERVVGTVPVEADGSAYLELPALRSFFFVALDEHDLSVKRMQSFLTVMPGEMSSCVGCHEQRTQTPPPIIELMALRRAPSEVAPIAGVPDVFDFPRDIQPILDRHCVSCHGYESSRAGGPLAGGINLSGDRGPMYSHSYFTLSAKRLFSDGRNSARSNYAPRSIGSSASRILEFLEPSHYGVRVSDRERTMIRLWIEVGAPYPGTYAALGTGMIGGYAQNRIDRSDLEWPGTQAARAVLAQRCSTCHSGSLALPESISDNQRMPPWAIRYGSPMVRFSRHILYNLSRPEKSLLLLAPLAKAAGGYETCVAPAKRGPIFADTQDDDYLALLESVREASRRLAEIKRFDMPGFRPRDAYIRELKRYGVLPADLAADAPVDPYAADRAYWESLWYRARDR